MKKKITTTNDDLTSALQTLSESVDYLNDDEFRERCGTTIDPDLDRRVLADTVEHHAQRIVDIVRAKFPR